MNIEVYAFKKKVTWNLLAQLEEARMDDMTIVLESPEERILGYVKPITGKYLKVRAFIIHTKDYTYRLVYNYNWEKASNSDFIAYGKIGDKVCMKKEFKDRETRDKFIYMFREIKSIAMKKQIFI